MSVMQRQTVRQATCTECGENEDNHTVENVSLDLEEDSIEYETRCECGTEGLAYITSDGVEAGENMAHDDVSWENDSDD